MKIIGSARQLGQSGSSLIESVIAVAVFLSVTLGFAGSTLHASRKAHVSRAVAEGTTLAFDKLEELRTRVLTHADLTSGAHTDTLNPLQPTGVRGGIYTRTWTVTADSPIDGMKRIEMRVAWPERGGAQTLTLVTYAGLK